jgi:hypothetical protein
MAQRNNHNRKAIVEQRNPDPFFARNEEKQGQGDVMTTNETRFDLLVDKVPYTVTAAPFSFNNETRFYVRINGGAEHVFAWDQELLRLTAIDDNASILPEAVEEAISQKLQVQR